jgi:hypothetical protein
MLVVISSHSVYTTGKLTERQKLIFKLQKLVDQNLPYSMQRTVAYAELYTSVYYPRYQIKNEHSLAILRTMKFIEQNETKVNRAKADTLKVLFRQPSKL